MTEEQRDLNFDQEAKMLANRLRKNRRRFEEMARRNALSSYRIYDGDIPEVPLYIDRYGEKIHLSFLHRRSRDDDEEEAFQDGMVAAVQRALKVKDEELYIKTRRRQRGGGQYEKFGTKGRDFQVQEGGLKFLVNLSEYLDTGLFLDHRITRERVRAEAKGAHVLNLFAYTGSFSVYAADGGARSTTTVDMSNTYLDWAKKNFELNGLEGKKHLFEREDILQWLPAEAPRRAHRYDLVIFDPPTFSRSKKMRQDFDIQRDHPWMLEKILEMTAPGGVIYFSNNFRGFQLRTEKRGVREIEEITAMTVPPDFQYSRPHRCWRIVK